MVDLSIVMFETSWQNEWLVGGIPARPLWKMMDFVSWDDGIPNMESHKSHVPNHQNNRHTGAKWMVTKAGVVMGGCRTTGQAAPSRASKTCRTFRDNLHSGRHRLDHLVTRPQSLLWGDLHRLDFCHILHHHNKSDASYISFIFMTINPI